MASGITLTETADGSIPIPSSGKATVFLNSSTGEPSYKDDTGTVATLKGDTGSTGPAGEGVPTGGTTGQVLAKVDGTNYNTEWVDQTGGAVDSVNGQTGTVVLDENDIFVGPFTSVSGGGSNVGKYLRPDSAGTGVEFGDASDLSPSIVIPIANVTNLTTELAGKLTATTTSPRTGEVVWYNGATFVNGPRVTTSATEPTSPVDGDIWFDMSGV